MWQIALRNMRPTEDSYRHKGLRRALVDHIREKGIRDERVLDAVLSVPRHFFLDSVFDRVAYEDRAFPIGESQTISQPYTVAYQTELLRLEPFQKVLEIGTGSAYQASILAQMKARVYTIERQRKLFDANKSFEYLKRFPSLQLFFGDGFRGLPTFAPFDRVIITAAAPEVPPLLIEQLRPGGLMVIPVNESADSQRMMRLTKRQDGGVDEERFESFSFVPMLEGRK
jgi:protein-L-isoaspartate(D-aspartate) O-methyltransferase